jgi:hypothetical protein
MSNVVGESLYMLADVYDINDPDDKGRVRVKFIHCDVKSEEWLSPITNFYGPKNDGWHGDLAVDDRVIISFFDYPTNQYPFILGKYEDKNKSVKRDKKKFMKMYDHKLTFESDKITIQEKGGTKIVIEDGKVYLYPSSTFTKLNWGTTDLIQWLQLHTHNGNLGFPSGPPTTAAEIVPPANKFGAE